MDGRLSVGTRYAHNDFQQYGNQTGCGSGREIVVPADSLGGQREQSCQMEQGPAREYRKGFAGWWEERGTDIQRDA